MPGYARSFLLACLALSTLALARDLGPGFSNNPDGPSAEQVVLKAIGSAKRSIHVAAYQLTARSITQALIDAHERGVAVQVILDKATLSQRQSYGRITLAEAGVPCWVSHRYKIMHHKFLVIDARGVESGSFNYTEKTGYL